MIMLQLDISQQAIISSSSIETTWLFEVTPVNPIQGISTFYWSLKTALFNELSYVALVDPESFYGVTMTRTKSEFNIIAPNETTFKAIYDTLHAPDFEDAVVIIRELISDYTTTAQIRSWKMIARTCIPDDGWLVFSCEDFLTRKLDGLWPRTALVKDIFPDNAANEYSNLCVPRIFGTAYIPLRPVYISGSGRMYLLGPADRTYTIDAVHSPVEFGDSEWESGDFTFQQSTHQGRDGINYRFVEPLIIDSDGGGDYDACGIFPQGEQLLDMPTKFFESITSSLTNPADVIEQLLLDIGVDQADIGDTFASMATIFADRDLVWNGGYPYQDKAKSQLSNMLSMCNAGILVLEKIELTDLSGTSVITLTDATVCQKEGSEGEPTYESTWRRQPGIRKRLYDSGYIAHPLAGKPQDRLMKFKVPVKTAMDNPSEETIEITLIDDSILCQTLGVLYHQRRNLPNMPANLELYWSALALCPHDVVEISGDQYGGTTQGLIDEVSFNKDGDISVKLALLDDVLDDWDDVSTAAIEVATGDALNTWQPVISGPDGTPSSGSTPNQIRGRLRIGSSILLDPDKASGQGAIQIGTDLDHDVAFNVHDDLYYDTGLHVTGEITAESGTIGGWIIDSNLLRSAATGTDRIELNKILNRMSIFDGSNEMVAIGFLDGLLRNNAYGTASSGGNNYLNDTDMDWKTDSLVGLELYITGGTGSGQHRTIINNTATQITVNTNWSTNPDATSSYEVRYGSDFYGFWAKDTEYLSLDGNVEYIGSEWVIRKQSSLKLDKGADITLMADDDDPGKLILKGTTHGVEIFSDSFGSSFTIAPGYYDTVGDFIIGPFGRLYMDLRTRVDWEVGVNDIARSKITMTGNEIGSGTSIIDLRASGDVTHVPAYKSAILTLGSYLSDNWIIIDTYRFYPVDDDFTPLGTNTNAWKNIFSHLMTLKDGVAEPSTISGFGQIFIDTADGDLKIKYGDGTVKTIVVDT